MGAMGAGDAGELGETVRGDVGARKRHLPFRAALVVALTLSVATGADADELASLGGIVVSGEPRVRVSLFEQRGRVRVIPASGRETAIEPKGDGLQILRGPRVSRWSSRGTGPFRVVGSSNELRVRGVVHVLRTQEGLEVINEVPLESYVAGTLGAEMYSRWESAALEAQAVAIRSYTLHQMNRQADARFDVRADVRSQVYGGLASESAPVRDATHRTRGEVLLYSGRPILAAFHSASGGRTASAEEVWGESVPYLPSVEIEGEDDSPDTYWRASIRPGTLGRAAASLGHAIGDVDRARVVERSRSGRALVVELRGERGKARVRGRDLRSALGPGTLKSTRFEIREAHSGVVFVGSGSGHGVGMSQWAAQAMALSGSSYREILSNFYPGTRLGHVRELDSIRLPEVSSAAGDGHRSATRAEMGATAQ